MSSNPPTPNLQSYELANNQFLREMRVGGSLYGLVAQCRPFDAVMVPPQHTFESFDEVVPPASSQARGALERSPAFLYRHLIRFGDANHLSTQFHTLDGKRGSFSDTLDNVSLDIASASPPQPQSAATTISVHVLRHCPPDSTSSAKDLHNNLPSTLNIFLIAAPLGTDGELRAMAREGAQTGAGSTPSPISAAGGAAASDGSAAAGAAAKAPILSSALDALFSGITNVFDGRITGSNSSNNPSATAPGQSQSTSKLYSQQQQQHPQQQLTPPAKLGLSVSPGTATTAGAPTPVSASTSRFQLFQKKMQEPESRPLVKILTHFVQVHQYRDEPTTGAEIRSCIAQVMREMKSIPLWSGGDDAQEVAYDGLEKYLTSKLYEKCFCVNPIERRENATLMRKMGALKRVVRPHHLECHDLAHLPDWQRAKDELTTMNSYKCPRDKLVCANNACIHIINALRGGSEMIAQGKSDFKDTGADDYLPSVFYCVLESCPENFLSNLRFIAEIRPEERMESEAAYNLTVLQSAAHFWLTCQAQQLRMTTEEFDTALNNIFALRKPSVTASSSPAVNSPVSESGLSAAQPVVTPPDTPTNAPQNPEQRQRASPAPPLPTVAADESAALREENTRLRNALEQLLSAVAPVVKDVSERSFQDSSVAQLQALYTLINRRVAPAAEEAGALLPH